MYVLNSDKFVSKKSNSSFISSPFFYISSHVRP